MNHQAGVHHIGPPFPRSVKDEMPAFGVLQATKTCPEYHGNANDFCAITSSNFAKRDDDERP